MDETTTDLEKRFTIPDIDAVATAIAIWRESKRFETHWHNVPEKLMLVVTELSEAMEAYRHLSHASLIACAIAALPGAHKVTAQDLPVDQYNFFANFREELADTFIRLLDLTGSLGINIGTEIAQKMLVNVKRPQKHGKEC